MTPTKDLNGASYVMAPSASRGPPHLGDRGAAAATIETQDAVLATKIEVAVNTAADIDRRLGQIEITRSRKPPNAAGPTRPIGDGSPAGPVRASWMSETVKGHSGRPQGRARFPGRPRRPDRDRGRADTFAGVQ
jgi:hypothetical protein